MCKGVKSMQDKIYKLQIGAAQQHVYSKHLSKIEISILSIERQKEIVEYCEKNDIRIKQLEQDLEENKILSQQFITNALNISKEDYLKNKHIPNDLDSEDDNEDDCEEYTDDIDTLNATNNEIDDTTFINNSDDLSQNVAQYTLQDISQDVSKDFAQDFAQDVSHNLQEDAAQDVTQDVSHNLQEDAAQYVTQDVSQIENKTENEINEPIVKKIIKKIKKVNNI